MHYTVVTGRRSLWHLQARSVLFTLAITIFFPVLAAWANYETVSPQPRPVADTSPATLAAGNATPPPPVSVARSTGPQGRIAASSVLTPSSAIVVAEASTTGTPGTVIAESSGSGPTTAPEVAGPPSTPPETPPEEPTPKPPAEPEPEPDPTPKPPVDELELPPLPDLGL